MSLAAMWVHQYTSGAFFFFNPPLLSLPFLFFFYLLSCYLLSLLLIVQFLFILFVTLHCQPEELTNVLEICNIVFTSMFSLEMILKLTAFGSFSYLRNPYNVFDGVIVIIR